MGCKSEVGKKKEAFTNYIKSLPELKVLTKDKNYTLIVDYVYDPLLPKLSNIEMKKLFKNTIAYTKKLLGYTIKLQLRKKMHISQYFKDKMVFINHKVLSYPIDSWYLDYSSKDIYEKVKMVITKVISRKSQKVLNNYFGTITSTKEMYVQTITDNFFKNLKGIYSEKDESGKPFYHPEKNNIRKYHISFTHWDAILLQQKDADFILTNTAIVGPDKGMPVYVIKRGGVTSAFVENNKHRPFQAAGVITQYPMLSNGPFFKKIRGVYSRKDSIRAIAIIWVHELGHFLMRKKENYSLKGSVHRTAADLDYKKWTVEIIKTNKSQSDAIGTLKKF